MGTSMKRRLFLSSGIGALSVAKGSDDASAQKLEDRFAPDTVRVGIVGCGPYSHGQSYGEVLLASDGRRSNKTHMRITHVWGDDYRSVFRGSILTSGKAQR